MFMRISDRPNDLEHLPGRSFTLRPGFFVGAAIAASLMAGGCKDKVEAPPGSVGIACKPAGAADFTKDCLLEKSPGPDGTVLTVSQPDGQFRRLLITKDGRGVVAADGAEPATVTVSGNSEIEVAIGGNLYRLPATLKGKPFKQP